MLVTPEQVMELANSLSVFQIRVIITVLTVLLIGLVVRVLLPAIATVAEKRLHEAFKKSRFEMSEEMHDELPPMATKSVLKPTFQFIFLLATGVFIASVWGLLGTLQTVGTAALTFVPLITKALVSVLLFVGAYLGAAAINNRVRAVVDDYNRIDQHQIEIIARTIQLFFIATVALVVLAVWEIQIGQILLGAGLLGIVIGLAVRETLGAVLAGFLLMLSRPFEIGDWIEAADEEGVVTNITILNTRLRSADGESIVIPNDQISSDTIINRSKYNRLRIDLEVGIDYDTNVQEACDIADEAIQQCDKVCDSPSPEVLPQEFGNSSIVLEARFWIDNPGQRRYSRAVGEVMKHVKTAFDANDISIPFPQRTISHRAATPDESAEQMDSMTND